MDLRYLRSFVAVAEERHFARAAERLHVAQPWLSQQIRRVEAELGVPVFERTTRRVDLTPAGAALLPRAREILAAVQSAVEDARCAASGELGRVAVGFTGSATYTLLPRVAKELRIALPRVELELHGEMLTPAQVTGLLDGRIDIGLLRPPVGRPEICVEVVGRESLLAAVPMEHALAAENAVSLRQLAGEPFVSYVSDLRSVVYDAVERACEAHGFVPNVVLQAAETATLVSFVAAGMGVALVPASAAHLRMRGAVYRPLAERTPGVELALAWRSDDERPLTRRALELASAAVSEDSCWQHDPDEVGLDSGDLRS